MLEFAAFLLLALLGGAATAQAAPSSNVRAMLDSSVKPCDDFYQFVCKKWKAANPIPPDQARWGQFDVLRDANQRKLKALLEAAMEYPNDDNRRGADFYAACIDESTIEARGLQPILPILSRIDGLRDKAGLAALLAELHLDGIPALFRLQDEVEAADSTNNIAAVTQSGLGMPDRDYYRKTDERSVKLREAYVAHVANILKLSGLDGEKAEAQAKAILRFETGLAEIFLDRVRLRNPLETNNPISRDVFEKTVPGFDWQIYFAAMPVPSFLDMNDVTPSYFKGLSQLLQNVSLDDLKAYLRWHALNQAAPYLSQSFVEEDFDFYGRVLNGTQELEPRWKRCLRATDSALGEDLGRLFVARYFPPAAKARVEGMVGNIRAALGRHIDSLDWMGADTKAKAKKKLKAMAQKFGYPEIWRDYSSIEIWKDDYLGNVRRAGLFEHKRDLAKIGTKVDRKEWFMTPPTVNAYYKAEFNDINFPAGILQPPFFDAAADDAVNFGGIGVVIGHEITHGFDDQGRRYDAEGNLVDWWTPEDGKRFEQRTQCLIDEYGNFTADGDVKLDGKLTLGENTADNGGARISYLALKKLIGGSAKKVEGLTPEQRFFIGMTRVWCSSERPEWRRLQAQTNPHSLPEYRVNGTLQNMPEFAAAWSCKAKDKMVSTKACRVW